MLQLDQVSAGCRPCGSNRRSFSPKGYNNLPPTSQQRNGTSQLSEFPSSLRPPPLRTPSVYSSSKLFNMPPSPHTCSPPTLHSPPDAAASTSAACAKAARSCSTSVTLTLRPSRISARSKSKEEADEAEAEADDEAAPAPPLAAAPPPPGLLLEADAAADELAALGRLVVSSTCS